MKSKPNIVDNIDDEKPSKLNDSENQIPKNKSMGNDLIPFNPIASAIALLLKGWHYLEVFVLEF